MRSLAIFAVAILACAVALPPAFSEDDYGEKDGNKIHFDDSNKIHFDDSNKTVSFGGYTNRTISFGGFSNQTNIGQLISDYVHQRNAIEKQQRNDILAAVKACSQVLGGSNDTAKQQCKSEIKSIRDQFRTELIQLEQQFKQFRENLLSQNNKTDTKQNHGIETPEKNQQVLYNIINNVSHSQHSTIPPKHNEGNKIPKNSHHH